MARLTADSIHALNQPILQFAPHLRLNFLERSTFASKPREKIVLMKGRASGVDGLSESLQARKLLPGSLEEVGRSLFL